MNRLRGRPSIYTPELAARICARLSEGMTLREVCRQDGMPDESTVRDWAQTNAEFSPQYARAREIAYHCMMDELLEIADDGTNDWMERNGKVNCRCKLSPWAWRRNLLPTRCFTSTPSLG